MSHSVHKPHGSYAAVVAQQPHAAPQDVHNPYAGEKHSTAVHAPAHVPVVHRPAPYHPAPIIAHPVIAHPAPIIAHRPVAVAVPPVVPTPIAHPTRPLIAPHPLVAHPAPIAHGPEPVGPAVYAYEYAVADDYSKANFGQNENRDGYSTHGEYRVALPDGRTQIVTYNVADAYSGYVADVKYEGVPHYDPAPAHPAVVKAHPAPVVVG